MSTVLIICITVAVCVIFIMATIAYIIDRKSTRMDKAMEFAAQLIVAAAKQAVEGADDE